ncbi:MAG: FtsW/RodA/SpoVE family cell cycle protein [Anaerolineae bacterium]
MTAAARRLPRVRSASWRWVRTFDWALLAGTLAATGMGVVMIRSATQGPPVASSWDDLVLRQVVFATLALGALALAAMTEHGVLTAFGAWIYVATVAALGLVLVAGGDSLGSARWFQAGFANLQPSEPAKVAMIVFLAAYFDRHDVRSFRHVATSLGLVGLVSLLVLRQPNLSAAVLLGVIWLGVVVAAGIRPLHLSMIALGAVPAAAVTLRSGLIEGYMLTRVVAWMNPGADPLRSGFQNIQTLIAVANGGLMGTGLGGGPSARGGWLVVLHTDNIFALVAEEMGFIGAVVVIGLLVAIVLRVLRGARLAQDEAGRLLAAGVGTYILAQSAVNIGVVLQLLPVTGVSLPFISYGGSSLVTLYAAIGLVEGVLIRRKPLEFT